MNKIPNDPHGCDFSRVKPWYLDNQARFLRQSILISRYETPEIRALFHHTLVNVQGKMRIEKTGFPGVLGRVKKGVKQVFTRLNAEDAMDELDMKFKHFTEVVSLDSLCFNRVPLIGLTLVVTYYRVR